MFPHSYNFYQNLCLNNFLLVLLIGNQRDQVTPFRYINRYDEVYHLVRGRKVLGDMKYLMRSVKRAAEAVGIWTEDNWDVKRVNSLYTMVSGRFIFKRNKRFDSLIWPYFSGIFVQGILQIILYLVPHSFKQRLYHLLTETSKCSYIPQLYNNITQYIIRNTVLGCPDSLQHGQNSYMGGYPRESGCLVCFIPIKFLCWNLDQRRIKARTKSEEQKVLLNIILGEVCFIYFPSTIKFLTAFV